MRANLRQIEPAMHVACAWDRLPDHQALKVRMLTACLQSGLHAVSDEAVRVVYRALMTHVCAILEECAALQPHAPRGRGRAGFSLVCGPRPTADWQSSIDLGMLGATLAMQPGLSSNPASQIV